LKINLSLCSLLLLVAPLVAQADPILIIGTPADSLLATPTGPSPNFHATLINFDNLTPFATFSSYTASGVTISSPDGFEVLPYSTQSFPNELFDDSSNGTANITISLGYGSLAIGVGIADSDPVSVTFQALTATGAPLGPAFVEDLATTESTINTGNGYYVVEDTSPDIFGLRITQSVGNAAYSGLAIDDVQVAPEPSSFLLVASAMTIVGASRLRKRA
jgi:hypothetical protein